MIRRLQARSFRCLRYVDLRFDRFGVLVGPHGSGKSAVFDAIVFLGDFVRAGLDEAVGGRGAHFRDLVWNRPDGRIGFELAIEVEIPDKLRERLPPRGDSGVFRYEVAIRDDGDGPGIASERGFLMPPAKNPQRPASGSLFAPPPSPPESILLERGRAGARAVVGRKPGFAGYRTETAAGQARVPVTTVSCGRRRSALRDLPDCPNRFPVATFVRKQLAGGVRRVSLDDVAMCRPGRPGQESRGFAPDGSNLAWLVRRLREKHREDYDEWLEHVRTVFEDLADIGVVVRPEDGHAYLTLRYRTGLEAPAWTASAGTMRILALTLLAWLPENRDVHLLEEPAESIHPLALDGVAASLRSAYDAQLLLTTHSLALVKLVEPSQVLCFDKDEKGATDFVRGDDHPIVREWRGPLDRSVLFAPFRHAFEDRDEDGPVQVR